MKLREIVLSFVFLFFPAVGITAQNANDSVIIPGPEPFSLDAISATQCINLLRANPLLEVKDKQNKTSILTVHTVWSVFVGLIGDYPPGFRSRYNIIVNGKPLDWDNCFIEYGGEMINLRLLFTYRNQYPPPNIDYRNNS